MSRPGLRDTPAVPEKSQQLAFTLPSSLTDSSGVLAVDPVDGEVLYRATFSLSFAAIDGAGKNGGIQYADFHQGLQDSGATRQPSCKDGFVSCNPNANVTAGRIDFCRRRANRDRGQWLDDIRHVLLIFQVP